MLSIRNSFGNSGEVLTVKLAPKCLDFIFFNFRKKKSILMEMCFNLEAHPNFGGSDLIRMELFRAGWVILCIQSHIYLYATI